MERLKRWIRRAIIHRYFPEVWYAVENWLSARTGDLMLEIGSGWGVFTDAVAKDSWQVISIDPAPESIAAAKQRVHKSGNEVTFRVASPEDLPLDNNQFDAITCINYLEFSPSPLKTLTEAFRVLKPGGKAVIVVFRTFSFWSIPWVAAALRRDIPSRPYRCFDSYDLAKILRRSGFIIDGFKYRARYLPIQPRNAVIPWPFAGAIVATVRKPAIGEQPHVRKGRKMRVFHK
jgi:ubiquinone/menaquinone biosynthesis C-methylase UbiE